MFALGHNRTHTLQTSVHSRDLFFTRMHQSPSHVHVTPPEEIGSTCSTTSVARLPILELDDYYSKFNEKFVMRELSPALWFDLISVTESENPAVQISECKFSALGIYLEYIPKYIYIYRIYMT